MVRKFLINFEIASLNLSNYIFFFKNKVVAKAENYQTFEFIAELKSFPFIIF